MATGLPALDPAQLSAANINPDTGLATDYLNHFNEAAMLADMLPDMPEMAEELLAWAPRAYDAHFRITGFRDADLVIAAWKACDPQVLTAFEAACARVEGLMARLQESIRSAAAAESYAPDLAAQLYAAISEADGVIHGRRPETAAQSDIDALFD